MSVQKSLQPKSGVRPPRTAPSPKAVSVLSDEVWVIEARHDYEGPDWRTPCVLRNKPSVDRLREILADEFFETIEEIPELKRTWSTRSFWMDPESSDTYVYLNTLASAKMCSYLEIRAFAIRIED